MSLVVLVILIYTGEDVRGWWAWHQFRQKWEAKGEKFDFKDFIPPPVPEEQNFALTPIVATCYDSMLDKNGHELKPHRTNAIERLWMPTYYAAFDYPTNIPRQNGYHSRDCDWIVGRKTDLLAWQLYYRALAAKTNDFPITSQAQSPAANVLLALSKYNATIEELRGAAAKPYSRFPLNYDSQNPYAIYLMHLYPLRSCNWVLQLRASGELQLGQSDTALADVKLMLRLIDSIRSDPFVISQNERMIMLNATLQPVWEGLQEHKWSDPQLAELNQELARMDFLADYEFSMRCERAAAIAGIENLRHTRKLQIVSAGSSFPNVAEERREQFAKAMIRVAPSSVFYRNKVVIAQSYQQWLLPVVDVQRRSASPEFEKPAGSGSRNGDAFWSPWSPNTMLADLLFPSFGPQHAVDCVHAQSSVDMARVACALERYCLAHDEYPDALDALPPRFIEKIPHDIIGGRPLRYRRTEGGKFLLYSLGWNEKDDGGNVGLTKSGRLNLREGDWVWPFP